MYAGGTPLSEAYGQRDSEMIALLERNGGAPNPSMAGLYRRKDLAVRLLAAHGNEVLPDDGFGSGPVAEQLVAAAAKGGDVEILALALQRVDWPKGDRRWYGALIGPLGFWNHWIGPWCHLEWDRTTYLQCFRMLFERSGPPVAPTSLRDDTLMSTPLGWASRFGRQDLVQLFLDRGADPIERDAEPWATPLAWAEKKSHARIVSLLRAAATSSR